jgi:hypothetical protein
MFFIVIPLKNSKLTTFYPEEFQAQNPLPLKNSKLKTFNPWRIPSSKPFTAEEYQIQNPLPLKNSKLKTFTPEEFQAQNPLPLKNSKFKTLYPWRIPGILDRGGGTDIKWNSPFKMASALNLWWVVMFLYFLLLLGYRYLFLYFGL